MNKTPEVVVVEDTIEDEMLTRRGISKAGVPCSVTVYRDGELALSELLSPTRELPRLVLLDLDLPKVDGLQILKKMRTDARTSAVPVVVFSGSGSGQRYANCYQAGSNSCVTKPTDPDEYLSRMDLIVRYWLTAEQNC